MRTNNQATSNKENKPLRVLMVTGIYPTSTKPHAGTFIQSQVEALVEAGLEVEVIHPRPGLAVLRYISAAFQVLSKTWTGRFDIVHGHYGLWCLAARMQWQVPVVASFLGDDILGTITTDHSYSKKGAFVAAISRKLCHVVDAIIVKSPQMKKAAGGPQHKINVIPNGVNFKQFRPLPRLEARAKLGWDPDRYYVLFGNDPTIPVKNFPLAQAAIAKLAEQGISAELVVATGLPHHTIATYINASNALLLTSIAEGSPNIVKEAMACNIPVVATNVGDVAEVIGRTHGCSVCPPDAEALARGLQQACSFPGPTTGRTDIHTLNNEQVAQKIISVYKSLVSSQIKEQKKTHIDKQDGSKRRKHGVLLLVENMSVPADPRVWNEARTLYKRGFQVCVICPKGETYNQEAYSYRDGIHIYRYDQTSAIHRLSDYIIEYMTALLKTFQLSVVVWRRHGFDVLHAANPPDIFFTLGLFYRLFGKKFVFDQHDLVPELFHIRAKGRLAWISPLLKFLEYCSYQTAHLVITTNASQKHIAIKRGHCPAEKIFIVRNGPEIVGQPATPAEPDLKRGKRYLLAYVGVMGIQDGVDYALYALNELVHTRSRKDLLLVLMGDGDQLAHHQELTHHLNLDEYVHFTGWVTRQDMLRYLAMADIGVSPDPSNELNNHSTMLKTMEYMAMGKPVVAFDLPETRYSAQEAALYATPNDIQEFADRIETLLDDESLRTKMGVYGRKRVEEELDWNHTERNLILAYQKLFPTIQQVTTHPPTLVSR